MNLSHLLLLVLLTYAVSSVVRFFVDVNELEIERKRLEKERTERQERIDALYGRTKSKRQD